MTRVVVADDHPLMLAGIESLLASSDVEIVGRATDGHVALAQIMAAKPDIALIDVSMPGLSGIEILRALRNSDLGTKVVLLTAHLEDNDLLEAMRLSVEGIVLKDGGDRQLVDCLEQVVAGRRAVPTALVQRALDFSLIENSPSPLLVLAPRERAIVAQVGKGLRNRDIAAELGMTEGTVKVYLHTIYQKLGVQNRTELAVLALPEHNGG